MTSNELLKQPLAPLNRVLSGVPNALRTLIFALSSLAASGAFPNPEYAARHGVDGLWTYNDHSKLPADCSALGDRYFPTDAKSKSEAEILNQRFARHAVTAQELGANYAVAKQDMSYVEYYLCNTSQ